MVSTYELCVLYRIMPKAELVSALKRTANSIFERGGFLRDIENLGTRATPYKMSNHGTVNKQASYFMFKFHAPIASLPEIAEEYGRDVDIIRNKIYKTVQPTAEPCTFHDEMQPAPYRKDVQELLEKSRKVEEKANRRKFKYNSGLDYYPFQK